MQKTISQMEAELDEEQNRLAEATTKLETSEKQLQKVSRLVRAAPSIYFSFESNNGIN